MEARCSGGLVNSRRWYRHLGDQILLIGITEGNIKVFLAPGVGCGWGRCERSRAPGTASLGALGAGENLAEHRSFFPNSFGEGTSIDAEEGRNAVLLEPGAQDDFARKWLKSSE